MPQRKKMATGGKWQERRDEITFVTLKAEHIYRASDEDEQPQKKQRLEDDGVRRAPYRPTFVADICPVLADVAPDAALPVCTLAMCRYVHDVGKYLETKPADIGPTCAVYKTRGHCPKGVSCRFGAGHITENGRNMVNTEQKVKWEKSGQKTTSFHTPQLEAELQSRTYDFTLAEKVLDTIPPNPAGWMAPSDIDFTADVDFEPAPAVVAAKAEERLGPCVTSPEFRAHVDGKKQLRWEDKLMMPAVANITSVPFRRVVKEMGADVTLAEPLVAHNLIDGSKFAWSLPQRHDSEDVFGVQIFGSNPYVLTRAAQVVNDKINVDFIDLHFGNQLGEPFKFRPAISPAIIKCLSRVTTVPLTAFMHVTDVEPLAPTINACKVSLVHLEARSYQSDIEWTLVNKVAAMIPSIPVFTTSDVFSYQEYAAVKEACPNLAGVTIARGALVKPWLFKEIKEQRVYDISSSERLEILQKFVNYGLEFWGSHNKGVELTRKFLLDWMVFLCRYIPVGLLETGAQRLNDRSARFLGRDDLETLMGSHDYKDWIKISEMLLGPVGEGFSYYPRFRRGFWPLRT